MSHRTITKRQQPPDPVVFEHRRSWGARLLVELNAIKKTSEWLAGEVGFSEPGSMRQIINGHQGISLEVYQLIVKAVPEMRDVPVLAHFAQLSSTAVRARGRGAPGPHKEHAYPKLGPREARRPK